MKKTKRILAGILTGVMAVSLLAGCGPKAPSDDDKKGEGGTEKIVMTLLTVGVDPVDMDKVEDAVNEISTKKIGVEVEFKPVSIFDAPSQVPMWIGGQEQIDLMCCAFTGLSPFIDMNMIEPIEEYLDECAPDLQKMAADGATIYDTTTKDHIYGVCTPATYLGAGGGYLFPKDLLVETGFDYENWDDITLDDLDEIFAAIKAKHPDSYMGTLGSLPASGYALVLDALGATAASGVLIGTESTKVENLFASDEYYDYLKHMRDWYEKGYILKDAATTDTALAENINNGTFWGNFTNGDYGLIEQNEISTGKEWVALMINQPYIASVSPASAAYWTVPVTSANPEAAVKFLNLMMSDKDVSNLLLWGIKEVHYSLEEDGKLIKLEASANWALPGVHGNQQIMDGVSDKNREMTEIWNEKSVKNYTKGYGFCYDASNMTNQLTAVEAVITEYQAALETGSVDLDTVYPEFLEKLEANGINEIIADKQAQFDAWLEK